MADIIQNGADGIKRRYVDMGDGTFAEKVAATGGSGGAGDASAANQVKVKLSRTV